MSWWSWFKIVRWLLVAGSLPLLPPALGVLVGLCICALIIVEVYQIT